MNKFEKTLQELKEKFIEIKEIAVVILYGSVARGDYSLRHSDMDLFVILNKSDISKKMSDKINKQLWPIGSKNGVKVHIEYQGKKVKNEDRTLIEKMIEEGKIIYSKAFIVFPTDKIGLKQYIIYEFSSDKPKVKTRISQILRGKKSWYLKDNKKVVKTYKGIADNEHIILIGKGSLMVVKDKQKEILSLFERLGVDYKVKKVVYA